MTELHHRTGHSPASTHTARHRQWWFLLVIVMVFAGGLVFFPFRTARAQDDTIAPTDTAACLECHGESVDHAAMQKTAHGTLSCQDCHKGVNQYPHPENATLKPTCASCHSQEVGALAKSAHRAGASGSDKRPDCTTCHGASGHTVPKITALPAAKQQAVCVACHKTTAGTLKKSAHHAQAANCLACHGGNAHAVAVTGRAGAQDAACRSCHTDIGKTMTRSAHGKAGVSCAQCHGQSGHAIAPASSTALKQKAECTTCHRAEQSAVAGSVHGKGGVGCTQCHGENMHDIRVPVKSADGTSCITCHGDLARTLASGAHGPKAVMNGKPLTCQTCHGENAHSVTLLAKKSMEAERCISCHGKEAKGMSAGAHGASMTSGSRAPNCVACHGNTVHDVKSVNQQVTHAADSKCANCHADIASAIESSVHGNVKGTPTGGPACLACHGGSAHGILPLGQMSRTQQEKACKSCHATLSKTLKNSVHDRPDKVAGDHPACLTCHGGNPHNLASAKAISEKDRAQLCGRCHSDAARMNRYGLGTAAYTSYAESFHGKALLRFNKSNAATCTDCHGLHGVTAPNNPESPVNKAHVVETCKKCHPGGNVNFAMSGANHLRMHIDRSPVLHLVDLFFRVLIWGSMGFLFGLVALDLRRRAFDPTIQPESGRPAAIWIAASFFALVIGILLAYLRVPYAWTLWVAAGLCMIFAYMAYQMKRSQMPHHATGKRYARLSRIQRIQHFLLAGSFTVLVLTGFPLRFAEGQWAQVAVQLFGGFESMRIIHRIAGVTMVVNWIWHLGYLIVRWQQFNFSFKSWTMFPTWKDVTDLFDTVAYGVGLRKDPPQFDRFQFREKFDYFADMWGTIVMGFSGFVMWFPTVLGNKLPDVAFGISYIAHSYEGLLAMLAIIVWHFYNVHFNPDAFPMNPAWLTGDLSEEEMAREHAIEKARLDADAREKERTTS